MQILVADDSRLVLAQVSSFLSQSGYKVIPCTDGEAAYERLRQGDLRLAILDWYMPKLDGVDVCRRLQEENRLRSIYTIIITAQQSDQSLSDAFKAGANDYISKPFSATELLARVNAGRRITDLQSQLTQAQKLESIGQLAAGIAHEINTPIQYVGDNLRFLKDAFESVVKNLSPALESVTEEARGDLDFLLSEVPLSIDQSLEGVDRVGSIVRAMKEFAHPGTSEKTYIDIHRAIDNTVMVAANEWKYVARIRREYDESLPEVPCLPGDINQVILNLIVNAAHAIGDRNKEKPGEKGEITLRTRQDGDFVLIEIGDTGCGIKPEYRDRIFDPFFTSKGVGKGTGQGLTIVHNVIVGKHGGTIDFATTMNVGTTFRVRLPLHLESSGESSTSAQTPVVTRGLAPLAS